MIFSNDTENPSAKSEKPNIKAEPLFNARELPADNLDNKEENDSENLGELGDQRECGNITTNILVKTSTNNINNLLKKKNPLRNGQQTKCNICRSMNHWVSQCPDRSSEELTYMVHKTAEQF